MFERLRHRLRENNERRERGKDEAAVEKFLSEHEQSERAKADPIELPPGRSNTDWTYVDPF
jgi:hypothetical protein